MKNDTKEELIKKRDALYKSLNFPDNIKEKQKRISQLNKSGDAVWEEIKNLDILIWHYESATKVDFMDDVLPTKNCSKCGEKLGGSFHMEGIKPECMKCYCEGIIEN